MRADQARLVLVHSPLVGPLTWQSVAAVLRDGGWTCAVPSLLGAFDAGPPYYKQLAARVAAVGSGPIVLVVHSGAGALVLAIGAACSGPVLGQVYVDALLPRPGQSWCDSASPELWAHLQEIAVDGVLPPWHEWYPAEAIAEILPDPELRRRFFGDVPRLPLAYFTEPAPVVADAAPQHAYLQLSEAYAPLADEAEQRGWRVARAAADHLAMLTQPEMVARHIVELLEGGGGAQSAEHSDSKREA